MKKPENKVVFIAAEIELSSNEQIKVYESRVPSKPKFYELRQLMNTQRK